jgi:uncharacterized protein (TIGR03437 family)
VVYNDADIDGSPVVWARELDDASNQKLIAYFTERSVWRFNPDELPATLVSSSAKPFISKIAPGAGRRDDTRDGISPGSIAVLLGGNLAPDVEGTTVTELLGGLPFRVAEVSAEYGNLLVPAETTRALAEDRGWAARMDASPLEECSNEPSVHFGDFPARVLGVSNFGGQQAITVRAPAGLRPGWAAVTVRVCGEAATSRVRVLPATPGIFQARVDDSHIEAVVLRDDGGRVDAAHPARKGEVLHIFATGLGVDALPNSSLIVGVNHHGTRLISAAPANGMPGVFDVAFEAPADAPSGSDVPLSLGVVVDGRTFYSNKSSLPME